LNTTLNVLGEKLLALMGDVHFRSDYDEALDSPEELLEIMEHNSRESKKIEAIDDERKERICNLMSTMLATALQKEAIQKYGSADIDTVRKILEDPFQQPDNQAAWCKLWHTEEQRLLRSGLTEEQCQAVMTYIVDKLPEAIMECLDEVYRHSRFIPRTEAQSITTVLAEMMQEVAT